MKNKINYLKYYRRETNKVFIGEVPLGSGEPIRIQSMTNSDTSDIKRTVDQIIQIADAGADFVRITVPTSYVAEKLVDIKSELKSRGYVTPLIADIHFSPKAAEVSANIIEKVRINPGNYIDKKQFKYIEYTINEYTEEIERIKKNFIPLLKICKEHNTSIRIGTNHGSLSDRILSKYGDTPFGMVESTMEFLRICNHEDFHNVVISMKASNPIVMIHATRLLTQTMADENMMYPIHLGVTEAGNENEGRIKSSIGIASLLADGIGDTIRVSLTESPEKEIPVAKSIVNIMNEDKLKSFNPGFKFDKSNFNPFSYSKRQSIKIENIGGENVPVVISDISENLSNHALIQSGFVFNVEKKLFETKDDSADYLYIGYEKRDFQLPKNSKVISGKNRHPDSAFFNYYTYKEFTESDVELRKLRFIEINAEDISSCNFKLFKGDTQSILVLNLTNSPSPIHAGREFFFKLDSEGIHFPVILKQSYNVIDETSILKASAEIGSLFIDGFGDGIWISTNKDDIRKANDLAFGILQACRTRITKTDYISCPSCGRTLFNLEETTAKIKAKTAHLKGLKIAIMGCIVNGPGEMADADFGYVGTGKSKVTLYKQKDVIKRNIPEEDAVDELLKIIEQYS